MDKKLVGVGAGLGVCFGAALGAIMHNPGLGVALGLVCGAALGAVWARKKSKD